MKKLNEVKDILIEDIDKLLARDEKIELLVRKTAKMHNLSTNLRKKVRNTDD